MEKVIRKIIGWVMLANIMPLLMIVVWVFSSDRAQYHWYIPYFAGYIVDGAILIVVGFFEIAFALLED